ncbi:hypothetical protein DFS34DRAFT_595933 [Phlyctochytrium arcticum]|nr:hypothetical protein DFS34DRAFT_595933 [Phlyctochytrium arcticum]
MTAAEAVKLVRRYLPHLVRRVHPDLFEHRPSARTANSASLQSVNSILTENFPTQDYNDVKRFLPDGQRQTTDVQVTFWCKDEDQGLKPVKHRLSSRLEGEPGKPGPGKRDPKSVETLMLAQSFLALYKKLGIPISKEDEAIAHQWGQSRRNSRSDQNRMNRDMSSGFREKTEFHREFRNQVPGDKASGFTGIQHGKNLIWATDNLLIQYDETMNCGEKEKVSAALAALPSSMLVKIHERQLVVMGKRFLRGRDGVIVIPCNATVQTLQQYLQESEKVGFI